MVFVWKKSPQRMLRKAVAGSVLIAISSSIPSSPIQPRIDSGMPQRQLPSGNTPSEPQLIVDEMRRIADQLDYIKNRLDIVRPIAANAEFEHLNDLVGYTSDFARLATALKEDTVEHRMPGSDSSHTTGALAQIELEFTTNPSRLRDYAALGLISETASRRLGYFSFGSNDVAEGMGTIIGEGSPNVEATERVLDGIAGTAWGVYGLYVGHGNWDVAQAYSAAARETTRGFRVMTLPMFEELTAKITGLDQNLISLWEACQKVRAAHGQPIQTIGEFYHRDPTILDRLNLGDLATADRQMGLVEQSQRKVVEHYRQTCISGICTSFDLRESSPLEKRSLGGIRLDQPLRGACLRGVYIDRANGTIVLLGERDFLARGIGLRDLVMALWLEFGPQPEDPQFSLDPFDIQNPSGPWLRARYMPTSLEGRQFGEELFAADLRLKELSFQAIVDSDGRLKEWRSKVPGFRSYAELAMQANSAHEGEAQWSRFWIIADRVTARKAGSTILLDARMAVRARRQVPDQTSETGLRDIETDQNSLEAQWAKLATAHYSELATESPDLARVREMAVAIAIAKSLKAAGSQVNLERVAEFLNSDHTPTAAKINAFSASWQERSSKPYHHGNQTGTILMTRQLHLFGGVDLTVKALATPDNTGEAHRVDEAIRNAIQKAHDRAQLLRFHVGGSQRVAVSLPLLRK